MVLASRIIKGAAEINYGEELMLMSFALTVHRVCHLSHSHFISLCFLLFALSSFTFCTLVVPSVIVASQCKAFIVWLPENTYVIEGRSLCVTRQLTDL